MKNLYNLIIQYGWGLYNQLKNLFSLKHICFLILLLAINLGWRSTAYSQTTINKIIATGNDDAEEAGPDATGSYYHGKMDLTSTDMELGQDFDGAGGYSTGTQKVGLRFTSILIPKGAMITAAYFTFRAVAPDAPNVNNGTTNLNIYGQLAANASTFSTTNFDISNRTLTSNFTSWAPSSWTAGNDYNSASIVSLIQEIVDQGSWASGNAMAFIISGTGHRSSISYNTSPSTAPKLVITYYVPSPGGVTGASIWLKGDAGITTGSTLTWADQSGNDRNGVQSTGAYQPTLSSSSINYNPALTFDGTNDYLSLQNLSGLPIGASQVEVFSVGNHLDLSGAWSNIISYGTGTTSRMFGLAKQGTTSNAASVTWGNDAISASGEFAGNKPVLLDGKYTGTQVVISSFGRQRATQTSTNNKTTTNGSIGAYPIPSSGAYWNGSIPEIIVYPTNLTTTQVQKVNTYLAIKYGITIDQTTVTNYIATDGTIFWNGTTNSGYKNNIAGIARDDYSLLSQKQSSSTIPGLQVAIGHGNAVEAANASNPNNFSADKSALVWGDNGGSVTSWTSTGAPSGLQIVARTWKVQKTGTVDSVKVQIADDSGSNGLPAETNCVALLVDADGNFASGATTIIMTLNGTNWECNVALSNGQFFTFATGLPALTTPVFNLGATSSRCIGAGSVTYTATASNNTGITYSLDATSLAGGNTIVSSTGAVTYTAGWTGTSVITASATGCGGPLTDIHTVTITAIPTITGSTPASRCGTGTVGLAATASAGTINWYAASTGGSSLGTGTSFTTPSISSTTTYWVNATLNGCTTASRTSVIATVQVIPTITGFTPASRCGTGTVGLGATASAGTINWYAASTGGSSLGTGTSFTTPSIASTTIYYVDATLNGCTTASRTAVTATINAIPTITGTTPAARCATGTVNLGATASAGTINWYAASTGGASLGSGTSFTTPSISSTTSYWVDATANSCTTASRTEVIATVNAIPTITGTTPAARCATGTVNLGATASAGTINWYAASTGGASLGTGTSFITPSISSTTSYWVDATANSCTTASRTEVIATVNAIPTITGTTPAARCATGTVNLGATASAGTINWYAASTGGASLGTGTSFTTASISVTTSYWVDATANGCTTASRTEVIATVNTIPSITGTTPAARCATGTVNLGATASAGTINWYAASTGGSSLGTGTSFTTPSIASTTIYYVDATANGCTTASRTAVTATINDIPTITGSTPGSSCGTGTVSLGATASAGTINWYAASTGGSSLGTGASFTTPSIAGTTIYYVDATANGCTTASRTAVTATVIPVPVSPTLSTANPANGSTICAGYNVGTVTATGGSGGGTGAANEYQFSINGGATFSSYTNSAAINTTGATSSIIVQSRRTGGSGCTTSAWSTISTWTISTAAVVPSLNVASPINGTAICVGTAVSATINAGTGGSTGATDTYEFSINNGSSWSAYTPGNSIATAGATTNVLIRTSRSAGSYGCSAAANTTIVTWPVNQLPTTSNAGSNQAICLTTATLAANTPTIGTGLWTLVSGSGTIVSTASATSNITGLGVGANVFRWTISNGACAASASNVTITRDAGTVGGAVSGSQTICYNTQAASSFVLSGQTGSIVKWQRSATADFASVTDIANITTTLTAAEVGILTTNTYLRAVVKSGTCSQDFSSYATVTINYESQWNGLVNTSWNTPGNWSCGVPYPVTIVTIPNGLARYPVISGATATANNFTIQTGAALTITGTLQVVGTITAGAASITADSGTLEMKGTAAQVIPANVFVSNTINDLIINNTAGVSLGGSLKISDLLSVQNGAFNTNNYLTLRSNSVTTARVGAIASTSPNPIVGDVTVERYVAGRRKYRLITSPVTTSASAVLTGSDTTRSIWGNWQNAGVAASGVGTIITGGTTIDGFDQGTINASLFSYDVENKKFVAFTSANGKNTKQSPLKAGVGYYMFVYGDRMNSVTSSTPNPTTLKQTGTLLTGSQTYNTTSAIPLSGTAGNYSLIGNPYACTFDWKSVSKTNVSKTIWGWDANLGSTGGYVTVTATPLGALVSPSSNIIAVNRYVQPGQAFFVQTTAANPQILITEADKIDDKAQINSAVFRGSGANEQPLMAINLLYNNGFTTSLLDGALVAYDDSFDNEVNYDDGLKMTGSTEVLAIQEGGTLLSISARKFPEQNDTLFIYLAKITKPQYTLQIFAREMEASGLQPWLYDAYLDKMQALSLTDTNYINFTVKTSDAASYSANRFKIVFKNDAILPVSFTNITAVRKYNDAEIQWNVSTENNLQVYELQRSADGLNFKTIANVSPKGNNNSAQAYVQIDNNTVSGNNYYRVKSVDFDGKSTFSKVVTVRMAAANPMVRVFPNPVKDRQIFLQLSDLPNGRYKVVLLTTGGQEIMKDQIDHKGGTGNYEIIVNKRIPKGLYYLRVQNNTATFDQSIIFE